MVRALAAKKCAGLQNSKSFAFDYDCTIKDSFEPAVKAAIKRAAEWITQYERDRSERLALGT